MDQASEELMKDSIWCDPLTGKRPKGHDSHSVSVDPECMSGEQVVGCASTKPRPNILLEFYNTLQNASKKRSNDRSKMSSLKKFVRSTSTPVNPQRNAFRSAFSHSASFDEASASHKTTFENLWSPLQTNYFRMPVLTAKEQHYLIRKACQTAQAVVERGRSVGGPIKWQYVEKYNGVQVYRGKARTSSFDSTMCMCGVARVPGTVKEVASLFNMASTNRMRQFGQVFPEFFQDGLVLYPLQEPTKENSLNQIAAKWMVTSCPPPLRTRDFCVLECQDCFIDTFGRKGWVLSIHSIKLPGCHELLEEFGLCRGSIYQSGIIITNAEQPYHVDILHIVQVNLKSGDAAPYGMLRERVACISRLYDILRGKRLNEQRYLGDLALVSKKTRSRCFVCHDPFHLLLLRKLNCRKCGEVVCSACSKEFDLVSREDLSSHYTVRICLHCYKIITTASGCLSNPSRREQRTSSRAVSNHRTRSNMESINHPFIGYHDDAHLAATQTQASFSPHHPVDFRQSHQSLKQRHVEDAVSDGMLSSSFSNTSSRGKGSQSQLVALVGQRIIHERQVDREQTRDTIRLAIKDGNEMRQRSKIPGSPRTERDAHGMPWSIFDRQHNEDESSLDSNAQMLHSNRPPRHQSRDVDHAFDLDTTPSPNAKKSHAFGHSEKQDNFNIWEKQEQFSRRSSAVRLNLDTDCNDSREQSLGDESCLDPFPSKLYAEEEIKSADFIDSVPAEYAPSVPENCFASLQNRPSSVFSSSGINSMLFPHPSESEVQIDEEVESKTRVLDLDLGYSKTGPFEQYVDTNPDQDKPTCLDDELERLGVPQDSPNAAAVVNLPLQSDNQGHEITDSADQWIELELLDALVEHSHDSNSIQTENEQLEQSEIEAETEAATNFVTLTEELMRRSSIDELPSPVEAKEEDIDSEEDVPCAADMTFDRENDEQIEPILGHKSIESTGDQLLNSILDSQTVSRLSSSSDEGEMGVDSESDTTESFIDSQCEFVDEMEKSFSQVEIHRVETQSALEYHV